MQIKILLCSIILFIIVFVLFFIILLKSKKTKKYDINKKVVNIEWDENNSQNDDNYEYPEKYNELGNYNDGNNCENRGFGNNYSMGNEPDMIRDGELKNNEVAIPINDTGNHNFMTNLCNKMEFDLKEKIKAGKCVCFNIPKRTRVVKEHLADMNITDELNLSVNDVIIVTKIFDDGWAFGSRVKGRFREGAFPIYCLENRDELFSILPIKDYNNNNINIQTIGRYSSVRTRNNENGNFQYYYHPVIYTMKYINSKNSTIKEGMTFDDKKEGDICNLYYDKYYYNNYPDDREINSLKHFHENINNTLTMQNEEEEDDDNMLLTSSVIIPELPQRPISPSYDEKVEKLRRSLERRQKNQQGLYSIPSVE